KNCWSVTYTHQRICALKGSTVDISCSYTYPSYHEIKKAFWFTKWSGMDPEDLSSVPGYEGHIEYLGDKKSNCTLRITDLRLSDSAAYRFRLITSGGKFAGSPVSLTVTDVVLEMDPTSVSERENVTLTCRTKCTLDPITAYSWYKNGQPIPNSNTSSPVYSLFSVSSEDAGRYSCAVEGHEDLPSPEETLTVTYKPKNTSVSVSPSDEIVEGSSVTLTCSSDANPPVDKYTWYKKNVTSPKASGQSYSIINFSSEDSGEYYCEAENKIGSINSTALMITVAGLQVEVTPATEKGKVTLTCSTTCTLTDNLNSTYIWRISALLQCEYSTVVRFFLLIVNLTLTISTVFNISENVEHRGISPSGEIVEGSSVTLTCSSDANPPVDKYTWYKKNGASLKGSENTFLITSISSEDRGEYYCEAENEYGGLNSSSLSVDIQCKYT
ncbi:sialoadhesin-like, partial [Coregonus clupeaformis]|uniref:sialoadhesin-like n=1 Tax=Coregonus clupeaformis TaxID=59861 RepID=UPI001E1C39EF